MNEITLILPDLHHRVDQATKIIRHVGADKVIALGDFYDDFDDTPEMVAHTSEWLVDFVSNPNHTALVGNHDQQYGFPYRSFQCSGYTQWKSLLINDIVPRKTWDKLKWFYFMDNRWLLTHAGLHKHNVPTNIRKLHTDRPKFIAELTEWLNAEMIKGFQRGANGIGSWIFNAGRGRGGSQQVGGITWCDFTREFLPVRGINQIMGHTPQMQGPRWCLLEENSEKLDGQVSYRPYELWKPTIELLDDTSRSTNIDLDVHGNMHYATWNGTNLVLSNYRDNL